MSLEPSVVVCIPALDEERTIGGVVRGALRHADRVIVVDDASSDRTASVARDAGASVLRLPRRTKVGGVVKTGLEYAKTLKPKIVVTMDADGQHDPEDIPRLLEPVRSGMVDWVQGTRFLRGGQRRSSVKSLGNSLFSGLVGLLLCRKITDVTCGFRVLTYEPLLGLDLKFEDECYPEMTITLCLEGYRMIEVPIKNAPRRHGDSRVVGHILPYGFKALGMIFYTFLRTLLTSQAS